jgi:hypothetical protein
MVTDDPPGIGFAGRDGTPPAMRPVVSVPGDNLLVNQRYSVKMMGWNELRFPFDISFLPFGFVFG